MCVDQDDIFGVVPFLLAKEGVAPKSGLTFTAKDPITVVFSIDTTVLKVCVPCRQQHARMCGVM